MAGSSLFHFNLYLAVAGVHIVELLSAAKTGIELDVGVQEFVNVEQVSFTAEEETQVVEARKLIVGRIAFGPFFQQVGFDQYKLSKVEVVTQATPLIVDNGMLCRFAISY